MLKLNFWQGDKTCMDFIFLISIWSMKHSLFILCVRVRVRLYVHACTCAYNPLPLGAGVTLPLCCKNLLQEGF
jgi:hypothetical protein